MSQRGSASVFCDFRVVVLDPRIVTKPYGRAFLSALPEGVEVEHTEPEDFDDDDDWMGAG